MVNNQYSLSTTGFMNMLGAFMGMYWTYIVLLFTGIVWSTKLIALCLKWTGYVSETVSVFFILNVNSSFLLLSLISNVWCPPVCCTGLVLVSSSGYLIEVTLSWAKVFSLITLVNATGLGIFLVFGDARRVDLEHYSQVIVIWPWPFVAKTIWYLICETGHYTYIHTHWWLFWNWIAQNK